MSGDNNLTTHFELAGTNDEDSSSPGSVTLWQRLKWEFQLKGLCNAEELLQSVGARPWLNVKEAIAPSTSWICWVWAMQVLLDDPKA